VACAFGYLGTKTFENSVFFFSAYFLGRLFVQESFDVGLSSLAGTIGTIMVCMVRMVDTP
jgi:hypothetical protein